MQILQEQQPQLCKLEYIQLKSLYEFLIGRNNFFYIEYNITQLSFKYNIYSIDIRLIGLVIPFVGLE